MVKKLILILMLLAVPGSAWGATTWTAADASFTNVSSTLAQAAAGDTVQIPADSKTWTSTQFLNIRKAITIIGAGTTSGANLTKITHDFYTDERYGNKHATINVLVTTDVPVRISGIYFDRVSNSSGSYPYQYREAIFVGGSNSGGTPLTQIRVDHNYFNLGYFPVLVAGNVSGVIDSNTFFNAWSPIKVIGDNDRAWTRPIAAGTGSAVFIEGNTFLQDNNYGYSYMGSIVYLDQGCRAVVRYNTFDTTAYTAGDSTLLDSHGNLMTYYVNNGNDYRGQPMVEIYNNTFAGHHTYRFMYLRGGSVLVHDNTFTTVTTQNNPVAIALAEEEGGASATFNPVRTAWPAEDQVNNSFFWNNKLNNVTLTDVSIWDSASIPFIQKDRDYFMHEPQATGGREVYTNRPGASSSFPTDGITYRKLTFGTTYTNCVSSDIGKTVIQGAYSGTLKSYDNTNKIWYVLPVTGTLGTGSIVISLGTGQGTVTTAADLTYANTGTMLFSSGSSNAYYPYTSYTYPHPLVGGGGGGGGSTPTGKYYLPFLRR